MKAEEQVKKLYQGLGWVTFFTYLRFWTGSLVDIENLLPRKGKILDLGAGFGIFANYLGLCSPDREVLGVELNREKLKYAKRGVSNVSFIREDITKMALEKCQAVILLDVLHHLKSYEEQEILLERCYQVLAKNGILLISEVDNKPHWKLILARLTDFLLYPKERIFYCYQEKMRNLLQKYFPSDKITVKQLKNNPFPHVVYLCCKE